jgi:hypothetical protein
MRCGPKPTVRIRIPTQIDPSRWELLGIPGLFPNVGNSPSFPGFPLVTMDNHNFRFPDKCYGESVTDHRRGHGLEAKRRWHVSDSPSP